MNDRNNAAKRLKRKEKKIGITKDRFGCRWRMAERQTKIAGK